MTLVPWPVCDALAIALDRAIVGAGVIFGDPHEQAGDARGRPACSQNRFQPVKPESCASADAAGGSVADVAFRSPSTYWRAPIDRRDRQDRRDPEALVERAHDRALAPRRTK